MWEDVFQVYLLYNIVTPPHAELAASDMTIDNAVLLAKAWLQENFNGQTTSVEIRRQPMDYREPPKEVNHDGL